MRSPDRRQRPGFGFTCRTAAPRRSALLLAVVLGWAACSGEGGPERVPLGEGSRGSAVAPLPPVVQAELDAGNETYRAGDYEGALDHFSEVTRMEPELAAGWYGVVMVQMALGNSAAADSAMARVHRLAPEVPLQHPGGPAPPNPHPIQQE